MVAGDKGERDLLRGNLTTLSLGRPLAKHFPAGCLLKRQAVSRLSVLENMKTEVSTDILAPHQPLQAQTTI